MVLVVVWVGDIAMAENASIKEQAVRVVKHDQTQRPNFFFPALRLWEYLFKK